MRAGEAEAELARARRLGDADQEAVVLADDSAPRRARRCSRRRRRRNSCARRAAGSGRRRCRRHSRPAAASTPSEIGSAPTIVCAPSRAGRARRSRRLGLDQRRDRTGSRNRRRRCGSRAWPRGRRGRCRPVAGSCSTGTTSMWRGHLGRLAIVADHRQPLGIASARGTSTSRRPVRRGGHADRMAGGAAPADRPAGRPPPCSTSSPSWLAYSNQAWLRPWSDCGEPQTLVRNSVRPTISSTHRRHVVLPAAGAEEVEVLLAGPVAGQHVGQMAAAARLRTRSAGGSSQRPLAGGGRPGSARTAPRCSRRRSRPASPAWCRAPSSPSRDGRSRLGVPGGPPLLAIPRPGALPRASAPERAYHARPARGRPHPDEAREQPVDPGSPVSTSRRGVERRELRGVRPDGDVHARRA